MCYWAGDSCSIPHSATRHLMCCHLLNYLILCFDSFLTVCLSSCKSYLSCTGLLIDLYQISRTARFDSSSPSVFYNDLTLVKNRQPPFYYRCYCAASLSLTQQIVVLCLSSVSIFDICFSILKIIKSSKITEESLLGLLWFLIIFLVPMLHLQMVNLWK